MTKRLVSTSSISINASSANVWEALIDPEIAKKYFFDAKISTTWQVGSPITFKGEFNGNQYEEKGIILNVTPEVQLQYSHWSNFDGLPEQPENYRTWTFDLIENDGVTHLSITEDNIPTEKQKLRSDEFWQEVLRKIKNMVET